MKILWEYGFFEIFCNFTNWQLSLIGYIVIAVGFVIQTLIFRKSKGKYPKWIYPVLLLLGIMCCELLSHMITGLELLTLSALYWILFCSELGVLIAVILRFAKHQ